MLGMVVGLGVGVVVGSWRSRGAIAATGLACVLAAAAGAVVTSVDWGSVQASAAAGGPVLHDSFGRGDSSSQDRQVLFSEGVRLFWDGTLVGVGPGRTKEALASIPAPYVKEAHNDYVATLVELGLIGGVGLVVLLASAAARLARVAGRCGRGMAEGGPGRSGDPGPVTVLVPSPHCLAALGAAFLMAGLFYEVLHFRHLWAVLGLVAGLDLILADVAESRRPARGVLALLRVLPGLVGVLAACGLPGAMGYFLAGPHAGHPRLWPTILVLLGTGMGIGTAVWLLLVPVIHAVLLPTASTLVMLLAGVSVATQLPLAVAKSSLQGLDDRKGSNAVTAGEEAAFLPAFGVAWLLGLRGSLLLVVVLIVADVVVAGAGWARLVRQVHGRGMRMTGRPDRPLARSIVSFGLLGQVGGLVNLLNLRLDFLVLGAIAGPAPLGVYAVASKFAELVRLPSLAVTWVSYPRIARLGPEASATVVRRQLPWLGGVGIVGAVVLALAAGPLLPALYGQEFVASVVPAAIIAVGLCASPAGGLAGGYLLGTRRPGTGSVLQAVGLLATLGLDLALIPSFGVTGAAVASAVAYLVTDVSTVLVVRRLTAGTPR